MILVGTSLIGQLTPRTPPTHMHSTSPSFASSPYLYHLIQYFMGEKEKERFQLIFSSKRFQVMEVAVELEDDLFFADLSKQISLLIMDDEDDEDPSTRCPSVSFQGFSRGDYPITAPPQVVYGQSCHRRDQSKGTGVFIPQSSAGRREQRHGKFNSFNTKSSSRHQDYNNTKMVSQSHQAPSYNNSFSYSRKA